MKNEPNELVEVIQADRDAASPFFRTDWARDEMLAGKRDDDDRVQAFARHRIAANPNPPQGRGERSGFFAGLEHIANFINTLDSDGMSGRDVRSAIYSECLTARPKTTSPQDDISGKEK